MPVKQNPGEAKNISSCRARLLHCYHPLVVTCLIYMLTYHVVVRACLLAFFYC